MDTQTECYAARSGEGYWTCDVPGGCSDCRRLAREVDDAAQLEAWSEAEATVPIVDVEPTAVQVTGRELRSGDVVWDVWGKPYKLLVVAHRDKSRTVRFTREDGEWDTIGYDETITVGRKA